MPDETQFALGRHDAAIEALARELHALRTGFSADTAKMRADVAELMALMNEIRGGAKVGLKVIAGVGAISSGLTLLVEKIVGYLHGTL